MKIYREPRSFAVTRGTWGLRCAHGKAADCFRKAKASSLQKAPISLSFQPQITSVCVN
jgi:DNA-directed RNA polymerase specialized sigma24 family protein